LGRQGYDLYNKETLIMENSEEKMGEIRNRKTYDMKQTDPPMEWIEPFASCLNRHGLHLWRNETTTLQINIGLHCHQFCRHCHQEASPDRKEIMDEKTIREVVFFAQQGRFRTIDITGGAPELHPHLIHMIQELAPLTPRLMLRTNLVSLADPKQAELIEICRALRVVLLASFPSLDPLQMEFQRGNGVFNKSIASLKYLNSLGYGREESDLELNLVSNPTEASLPISQEAIEEKYRVHLLKNWQITFHHLFSFTNVPLGRFRQWLKESQNLENYLRTLVEKFNPTTVSGLMCRSLLSVSWEGYLYDCDFNLAHGLPFNGRKTHITEIKELPPPGTPIAFSEHCYACTAQSGFT
jgi:radical SAM/Cys-rich protein